MTKPTAFETVLGYLVVAGLALGMTFAGSMLSDGALSPKTCWERADAPAGYVHCAQQDVASKWRSVKDQASEWWYGY